MWFTEESVANQQRRLFGPVACRCYVAVMLLELRVTELFGFLKGLYQVVWQTPGLNFFFFCPVFEAYLLIMGARNFLSSVLKIDGIRKLK